MMSSYQGKPDGYDILFFMIVAEEVGWEAPSSSTAGTPGLMVDYLALLILIGAISLLTQTAQRLATWLYTDTPSPLFFGTQRCRKPWCIHCRSSWGHVPLQHSLENWLCPIGPNFSVWGQHCMHFSGVTMSLADGSVPSTLTTEDNYVGSDSWPLRGACCIFGGQ